MPTLTIDGRPVTVPAGATIKDAAEALGLRIPTLCWLPERPPGHAACMICVVRVGDRLVPSCATPAADGMVVDSASDEVRAVRRQVLELMLSDHLGDCEAPCESTCPAAMEIPQMMRHVADDGIEHAIRLVKREIALPAVLGRICPEICEKSCRRQQLDQPLAICLVKRYVGDFGERGAIRATGPVVPSAPPSGRRVAVVGAGPTGLAATFYLRHAGHAVTLIEARATAGGCLRQQTDRLPATVLDDEIAVVMALRPDWRPGCVLGRDLSLAELKARHDAVLVCIGKTPPEAAATLGLALKGTRPAVDLKTLQTPDPAVFAAGELVRSAQIFIRLVADGKLAAVSIGQFLAGAPVVGIPARFNSRTGRLTPPEVRLLVPGRVNEADRTTPDPPPAGRYSAATARDEARRCLHCDCIAKRDCELRALADEYGAAQKHYPGTRRPVRAVQVGAAVVFEAGKCIACGRCVYLSQAAGEEIGLAFRGRGFPLEVTPAFDRPWTEALAKVADRCVEACPTGALARRKDFGSATE
jgi:ferredoxin